jgi:hypothetical protein
VLGSWLGDFRGVFCWGVFESFLVGRGWKYEDDVVGDGVGAQPDAWMLPGSVGMGEMRGGTLDFRPGLRLWDGASEVRLDDDRDSAGVELLDCLLLLGLSSLYVLACGIVRFRVGANSGVGMRPGTGVYCRGGGPYIIR